MKELEINYWIGFSNIVLKEVKDWSPELLILQDCGIKINHINTLKKILPNTKFIEQNTFSKPSEWQEILDYSFQMTNWAYWKYTKSFGAKKNIVDILPYPIKTSSFFPAKDSELKTFKNELQIPIEDIVIGRVGQSNNGKWSFLLIETFEDICNKFSNLSLLLVNPSLEIVNQAKRSRLSKKFL